MANFKRIPVNNGGFLEIEVVWGGMMISSVDEDGTVYRRDVFDDGEIVMAINLLRHMRDENIKSVFLKHEYDSGDDSVDEFRLFQ